MCDLSLATGHPLAAIRMWPDRDLRALMQHTAQQGFPLRRLELTLARVGQLLAKVIAGADLPMNAFLIDPDTDAPDEDAAGPEADDMADFFGCSPTTH